MSCDTKERIAQTAIDLFSQYGFAAVSIRDICRAAGVKESTIYYHFTNKQAILDELLGRVDEIADQKQARFDAALERAEHVTQEEIIFVAQRLLDDYLLHPSVFPLIRMLSMERIHDEKAEQKYRHIVFCMPLEQQQRVFERMISRGLIKPCDAEAVSRLFYGVIYTAFSQLCLGAKSEQQSRDAAHAAISSGISSLFRMIRL